MPGQIVSPEEASVLLNINESSKAFDLAGATHLSPSRVKEILDRLKDRNFVAYLTVNSTWRLTNEGRRARNLLAHPSSSNTYVILDDRDFPTSVDEGALDSALDDVAEK